MRREINAAIRDIPLPDKMRFLPVSSEGYPVPWFAAWIDGVPDLRQADTAKLGRAIRFSLCWLCGQTLGRHRAFVIGPMCAVNRLTSEPPCHYACAEYAVRACPFLTRPRMRRNEKDLPDGRIPPPGFAIKRNPGACIIWVTKSYRVVRAQHGNDGLLFRLGLPHRLEFWAEGRPATRDEIMHSIETGLPDLRAIAAKQGPEYVADIEKEIDDARRIIDAGFAA